MRLGIISALAEEQQGLIEALQSPARHVHGMREYTAGKLWEIDAVCVLSRIGKVAAAMTAAILVEKFGVTHIVFTGVAGSGDKNVKVGDIVVADSLIQHDFDASPLFPRFEIPLTGLSSFATDVALTDRLVGAASTITRVHRGLIASGDQFIGKLGQIQTLKAALPDLLAVEMEGAAVAKCVLSWEYRLP
jgi:adenosylhomocysteine nucleosidase